jgi:hypothetical protein
MRRARRGLVTAGLVGSVGIAANVPSTVTSAQSIQLDTESTVVVTPGDPAWEFVAEPASGGTQTVASGELVDGPDTPPLGTGSAELSVGNDPLEGQSLIAEILGGTRLDRLERFDYSSAQPAGTTAVSVGFSVRYDGEAGPWQGRLVYEPRHDVGSVDAGWQRWNTLEGSWWASNAAGAPCVEASPCTWSDVLDAFPDAVINPDDPQVAFKLGSGLGGPFTGNVDHLTIGVDDGAGNVTTTNYDFELAPAADPDYTPVDPDRLFDTRVGTPPALREVAKQKVSETPLEVQVTDLPGGMVPATGVGAVSLNVTATNAAEYGFVTVTACDPVGEASSVNFQANKDRANLVLVPVSPEGTVCFTANQPVDLAVDVNGWFASDAGLTPVTPTRVFDTRPNTPEALRTVDEVKVGPSSPLTVKMTDLPDDLVPADGVGAVSLNVTATESTHYGFVTVTPCDPVGEASNVNFQANTDIANAVLAPVSADGEVCFTSDVDVHLAVDINGWFADTSDLNPVTPTRVFDTRAGTPAALREVAKQQISPTAPLRVKMTDLPGGLVPASGVGAVSLTVTATNAGEYGFITVSPCGPPRETSSVNFQANVDTANAVLSPVSADGEVCFTSNVAVDVVVDVSGWFSA